MYETKINILDTGDNYILAPKNDYYKYALDFYEQLDITITEIETDINVTEEILEFIICNIGRVLAYGFSDTDASIRMDIPDKLIEDIKKTIDFYKVKRFWENIQFPPKAKVKYDENMYLDNLAVIHGDANSTANLVKDTNLCDLYILYNSIYNLTLVVSSSIDIHSLIKYFPDFSIAIETTSRCIGENMEALKNIFNQKSFKSLHEIRQKFKAFENLYNVQQKVRMIYIKNS